MGSVAKLELVSVGEGFRFDPVELLEAAKAQGFVNLVILGELDDGALWLSSMANAGEAMILLERAKNHIVRGPEPDE